MTACATPPTPTPDVDLQLEIVMDPGAARLPSGEQRPPAYTGAWLVYAAAQVDAFKDLQRRKLGNGTQDDFEVEVRARSAMAAYWREQLKEEGAPTDPYLAGLVEIDESGFMEEYVIGTFAKPGWSIPSTELANIDLAAFWQWANEHIQDLESPTYARIRIGNAPLDATIPGGDLPDPEQYAPYQMPCTKSLGPLSDAVAEWELRAADLAGAPISAEDRRDFNWTLSRTLQMEPFREKGLTWVSSRPAILAYIAGFCAVDMHDYTLAERFLTTAADLRPLAAGPKLELAQALVAQKKLEPADALIQAVIDTAQDECDLARAWRKRGYIRFEQGELVNARSAYKRSLDFDPFSELAISELQLLEAEIVAHGGNPEPYTPPPSQQFVTQCQGG